LNATRISHTTGAAIQPSLLVMHELCRTKFIQAVIHNPGILYGLLIKTYLLKQLKKKGYG
jgi:hypothetical protein